MSFISPQVLAQALQLAFLSLLASLSLAHPVCKPGSTTGRAIAMEAIHNMSPFSTLHCSPARQDPLL
jgi:hypothetical protein